MNEAAKYKQYIERYTDGVGLDLGSGGFKIFENTLAVDRRKLPNVDLVDDIAVLDRTRAAVGSVDFILASHCLEHMKNPKLCIAHWCDLLKAKGYIIIILPDPRLYLEDNPEHLHMFIPSQAEELFEGEGFKKVMFMTDMGYNKKNYYSFVLVYQKVRGDENDRQV